MEAAVMAPLCSCLGMSWPAAVAAAGDEVRRPVQADDAQSK